MWGAPVLVQTAGTASSTWRAMASRRTAGQVQGHQEVGTCQSLPHEVLKSLSHGGPQLARSHTRETQGRAGGDGRGQGRVARGLWGFFTLSVKLFCKPKTALKKCLLV